MLKRYDGVFLPRIYLKQYDKDEAKPWKDGKARDFEFFNFGFNEKSFSNFSKKVKSKASRLRKMIEMKAIELPDPSNELEYLFALPADFGGFGDVYDVREYSAVNLFENKHFNIKTLPQLKCVDGTTAVYLEQNASLTNVKFDKEKLEEIVDKMMADEAFKEQFLM